ncbi:velvet factor-domain-containing protein [Cercophora newfieldiana]|uniref:Velvet factor-domain-containing protein n=1 Tax=Cercophora newfieldiana TaxID=92897 RepID=A0AA39XTC3_9PEZI|nr:velvet factor-domain-containing protein [Cercophora newfieldiana]
MGAPVLAASAHAIPAIPAAPHDSDANKPFIINRKTRSNRTLWYCLKVIQQPERARACGSGPKSSADRRPVDPPPVVELRIYEGDSWERAQNKDITFLYNANFFLYATLEHARVMAHGRVQTPAANSPPVLTGMPVSGMAYLDRPQEAGYFLFPDLSVRHEGRYKLTFNLYEQTKEDEDKDPITADNKPPSLDMNPAAGDSFDFRMEVKSQDFVVYSAKKFPGLTESTALSRVVAEQGCRVRIRRDVRMRRRDGKGGGGGGDYDQGESEFARRRTATPDRPDPYRARSMSGSTERTPYPGDPQRRPSIADYPPQYPAQPSSAGGHLQFLGGNSNPQYPPQPQPYVQQPSSVPASPVYPPSQNAPYSNQQSYLPPPPAPPAPFYNNEQRTPSQPYVPIGPSPRRESGPESRGPSSNVTLPPISLPAQSPSQAQHHGHHSPPKPMTLPPIDIAAAASRLPVPNPSPTVGRAPPTDFPASGSLPPLPSYRPPPPQYAGTKRAHDESFRPEDTYRFQDGARDHGNADDVEPAPMIYKRAAGNLMVVSMPSEY